ncbi:MAG TPA: hypothetical protein V6C76_05905 [Drouetiella sp.]
MASSESASLKSNSDNKSDKTGAHPDATDKNDKTKSGTDNTAADASHDNSTADPNKLHEDSWFSKIVDGAKSVASTVLNDAASLFNSSDSVIKTDKDLSDYTFSMDIFKSTDTQKPAAEAPVPTKDDTSNWFTRMGKAAEDFGGKMRGGVTSALDWMFTGTDSKGNESTVTAKNGEAHVSGKNQDGVPVDVKVDKHVVEGEAGSVKFRHDKDTNENNYDSGRFQGHTEGDIKTVVDKRSKDTFQWDEKTQKGFLADASGKHILEFDSKEQLTQQLDARRALTQTQERADCTADAIRARMMAGLEHNQTKLVVDKDGDYAVVRNDGLMVKTYKQEGYVTIEKDGHMIKIQNNQAFIQHEDPVTHQKDWVAMRGRHGELPHGLHVDDKTGAVTLNGQKIVNEHGNVQAEGANIDIKAGRLTTTSDTGPVTVDNSHGRTTVTHPGVATIVNDGHTFINTDPKTRNIFASMDSDHGQVNLFGGENGSGVKVDLNKGGNLTFTEPDGQVTNMNNQGYFNSCDAQGRSLIDIDPYGNVNLYDGTRIGADGSVSNRYGSGQAWDNGQSASAAISNADSAVMTALAASGHFDPTGSSLGALDAADSELSSLAQAYTAMGRLDLVGAIHSAQGEIGAARARVLACVSASNEAERRLGDGSATRVAEAINSGSPENYIRSQEERRRGVEVA